MWRLRRAKLELQRFNVNVRIRLCLICQFSLKKKICIIKKTKKHIRPLGVMWWGKYIWIVLSGTMLHEIFSVLFRRCFLSSSINPVTLRGFHNTEDSIVLMYPHLSGWKVDTVIANIVIMIAIYYAVVGVSDCFMMLLYTSHLHMKTPVKVKKKFLWLFNI